MLFHLQRFHTTDGNFTKNLLIGVASLTCWFWNEGKEERIANFLHSVTIAPNKGFTDIDRGFWDHCCPVSKKEITFYEDEK